MGARLPARLPATQELQGADGHAVGQRVHCDRYRARPARHRRVARVGARRRGRARARVRQAEPCAQRPGGFDGRREGRVSARVSLGAQRFGHHLRGHARRDRVIGPAAQGCGAERDSVSRGVGARCANRLTGSLHHQQGPCGGRDAGLRHGHRQAGRAVCRALPLPGFRGAVLPGDRPRRTRRTRVALRAAVLGR